MKHGVPPMNYFTIEVSTVAVVSTAVAVESTLTTVESVAVASVVAFPPQATILIESTNAIAPTLALLRIELKRFALYIARVV